MRPGYRNQNDVPQTCSRCNGRGWVDNLCVTPEICNLCHGRGTDNLERACHAFNGTGRVEIRKSEKLACPSCNCAGVWPVPEKMKITQYAFDPDKKK